MKKEYKAVSIEKHIEEQTRRKFNGVSLNKALKILLIQSGDYVPVEEEMDFKEVYDKLKYYVDSRLGAQMEKVHKRFMRIESELSR